MTLENLSRIGQLKPHRTDAREINLLIESAERNLADANAGVISPETRFDAAYKTIMQSALAVLLANGYRPDTTKPGHHMTVVQSLPKTMGLSGGRIAILDVLRKKRNLTDYTGEGIDDASLCECIHQAEQILTEVKDWFRANQPNLFS